uniref:Laccase-6-like n=1 Tax=Saccoglossus kowalevskii TaxID=10224 RepID=A0ABM0LVL9_SACKO|nr:PREDICTED: laccase-6-like [Saccoglossus kowalevskii]
MTVSSDHHCRRQCEHPMESRVCEYRFEVEWYYSMSKACYNCPFNKTDCARPHCVPLNGVPRPICTVNRMLPGPSIEVCHGDTVIVDVINHLDNGEGVTIHWHGQHMRGSQYMDGASMITQCPITYGSTFRYEFEANTFVDEGVTWNSNHPMHLHGYSFRVVAIEKLGESTSVEEVMRMDAEGKSRILNNALSVFCFSGIFRSFIQLLLA